MKKVLNYVLDPNEFLSEYGIRALSKYHKEHPYQFKVDDEVLEVSYQPAESDSYLFGGNSNWRGPIWFPVNYMIIESLWKYALYYGNDYELEYPSGSGKTITIKELSNELSMRLINIFKEGKDGKRPVYNRWEKLQTDPHFKDHILFFEYFHGDTGAGVGANHQTGWTGLVADLIYKLYE